MIIARPVNAASSAAARGSTRRVAASATPAPIANSHTRTGVMKYAALGETVV
jgi:hypothetical protein